MSYLNFYTLAGTLRGNLEYGILGTEKFMSSNGKLIKEDGFSHVQWELATNEIELKLKHGPFENEDHNDTVGLLDYWKK